MAPTIDFAKHIGVPIDAKFVPSVHWIDFVNAVMRFLVASPSFSELF